MKKILFEINHPAHVHLFRNLIRELEKAGHPVVIISKSNPEITSLLDSYGFHYIRIGRKNKNILLKYIFQVWFLARTTWIVHTRKIKIGIGVSMTLPLVSKFSRMVSICLDDDDVSATPVFARYASMAGIVMTPSSLASENRGPHHVSYQGFHELAYLHPSRFTPDDAAPGMLNLKPGEPYFVLRFNSFKAHHDGGESGLDHSQKIRLIELLKKNGKVFVTSEGRLDPAFEPYRLPVSQSMIHSVLFHAAMFIGDSQTMTSEAAVLGIPALKCNTFAGRLSVPNELEERYGLCYAFLPRDFDKMTEKISMLLSEPGLREEWIKKRKKLLEDKIDVTAFLSWFIDQYPESEAIVQADPAFQYRFR